MADKSLYERLGGAFAIAAVVNYFSDEIIQVNDLLDAEAEPLLEI